MNGTLMIYANRAHCCEICFVSGRQREKRARRAHYLAPAVFVRRRRKRAPLSLQLRSGALIRREGALACLSLSKSAPGGLCKCVSRLNSANFVYLDTSRVGARFFNSESRELSVRERRGNRYACCLNWRHVTCRALFSTPC